MNTNNIDARLVYENAREALERAFPNVSDIIQRTKLTQNTYRFERELVAGNRLYSFPVLANEDVFSNTEIRIKLQDSAIIYSLGVFIAKPASATDTAFLPKTYPNSVDFGANTDAQLALYNGILSISVNNDIVMTNWDVLKHYNAPETQLTAAANSPVDQMSGTDGFYPMEPNVVLIGSKNNVIEIELPVGISAVEANSRLIIIARAIKAQNSTVVT